MTHEDLYTEAADRFGAIAKKYCGIVESASNFERPQLLEQIYDVLPALIDAAIHLPETNSLEDDTDNEVREGASDVRPTRMDGHEWQKLYQSLKDKLGDADLYRMVFNAAKDAEAIHGSLADDIADIYRDLKEGLILKDEASPRNAIWEWRFGFDSHWGHHAIDALKAIHDIRNY